MEQEIVWTPEGSVMGIGTVKIPRPTKPLTMEDYRRALADKIRRMVREAGDPEARRLLRMTSDKADGLALSENPERAPEAMVEESETLMERAGLFAQTWPIQPSQIKRDLTRMEPISLEEYLGRVYHGQN